MNQKKDRKNYILVGLSKEAFAKFQAQWKGFKFKECNVCNVFWGEGLFWQLQKACHFCLSQRFKKKYNSDSSFRQRELERAKKNYISHKLALNKPIP